MPAESIAPPPPGLPASTSSTIATIKCSHCGGSSIPSSTGNEGVVILDEEIERICAACWRIAEEGRMDMNEAEEEQRERQVDEDIGSIGLGLRGMSVGGSDRNDERRGSASVSISASFDIGIPPPEMDRPILPSSQVYSQPLSIAQPSTQAKFDPSSYSPPGLQSHSLPSQHTRPWTTHSSGHPGRVSPIREESGLTSGAQSEERRSGGEDRPSNPVLDVTRTRMSNLGRGALYPGAVFKGTQTSGRSAYDVEVRFIDVNFPESSVSGYLSISHLTDTHPHLTTFFTGEIIGPKYGFITGARFGATEHDDMRHWGRFEQFRRPATRADMIRPELLFRDPVPRVGGIGEREKKGIERDFVFLRIKERFLVPDHTVRDISGASFAGFYFAMIDLNPTAASSDPPMSPSSPTVPKSPTLPLSPPLPQTGLPSPSTTNPYFPSAPMPGSSRRQSHGAGSPTHPSFSLPQPPPHVRRMSGGGGLRSPGLDLSPGAVRKRRESSSGQSRVERELQREATIRGYYFHSLNQEPFQELFLTHIPNRSSGTYEMR